MPKEFSSTIFLVESLGREIESNINILAHEEVKYSCDTIFVVQFEKKMKNVAVVAFLQRFWEIKF